MIIVDLGLECNVLNVPLELVVMSQVDDKERLVSQLLISGACVNGSLGCTKPPLVLVLEAGDLSLASVLVDNEADLTCVFQQSCVVESKVSVATFIFP